MKIVAKIKSKYLDQILRGEKPIEFRQFDGTDTMELTDETGRTVTVKIKEAFQLDDQARKVVSEIHSNVAWWLNKPIFAFRIGRKE
jgi:hypothetical protein